MRGDSRLESSAWPMPNTANTFNSGSVSGQYWISATVSAVIRPSAKPTNGTNDKRPAARPMIRP